MTRLWPRSLQGQVLLAIAVALLFAQGLGAALLYGAQAERREAALLNAAAFRLLSVSGQGETRFDMGGRRWGGRGGRFEWSDAPPAGARDPAAEKALAAILTEQGVAVTGLVVTERPFQPSDRAPRWRDRGDGGLQARRTRLASLEVPGRGWLTVRTPIPANDRQFLRTLIVQTLLIYAVLVGAVFLLLRRITRPLAALTRRVESFSHREAAPALMPTGPDDIRRLIVAHNAMEGRVAALLDEKDVMLGAIGHDLKTPLTALRVRIESVENEAERARMASVIEDIVRTLDDILSLARVGRPSDPLERGDLGALVSAVVEEFEDTGADVSLDIEQRIVLSLRETWLRRALRNLISNALRYGSCARVRVSAEDGMAAIQIDDDGPGIAEAEIARMMEPFTRLDTSRNSDTGGAGLGLTLARAIADQHGGSLTLANRRGVAGAVEGLTATLRLPRSLT